MNKEKPKHKGYRYTAPVLGALIIIEMISSIYGLMLSVKT